MSGLVPTVFAVKQIAKVFKDLVLYGKRTMNSSGYVNECMTGELIFLAVLLKFVSEFVPF